MKGAGHGPAPEIIPSEPASAGSFFPNCLSTEAVAMEQVDNSALLREFWYYYLVYYFVYWFAALLLARFVISLFVQPQSLNIIWRVLVLVTDPLLRLTAPLTPAALSGIARPLVTTFWLIVFLLAYWILLHQFHLAPTLQPSGEGGSAWNGSSPPQRSRSAEPWLSLRWPSAPRCWA
jgi:hypothetical protein